MNTHFAKSLIRILMGGAMMLYACVSAAQPGPPPGGPMNPPPPGSGMNPPIPQPGPPPSMWGSPWWNGWNTSPSVVISPSITIDGTNSGNMKVIACGYDAQGVWRVLPLYVNYNYNGVNYNVTVLNAWDPWTDMWNKGVDVQAFATDYTLRGVNYNYYVVLSFGTFYFNL